MTSRVILADDHPLLLRGLADLVSLEPDFEVVGAVSNGHDAMALIDSARPDLAIVDVSMPGLGGLAILRKVSRAATPVRIVFLTATITPEQISEALAFGAWGLLLKETASEALIDCLRAVARGERWHPPELLALASGDRPSELDVLTRREREIVDLACRGLSNKAIAAEVGAAEGTIKIHLHNIFKKMNVTNRTALAALSFQYARSSSGPSAGANVDVEAKSLASRAPRRSA